MDNLEYIEAYYTGEQSASQKKEFEDRILNDRDFANELAFYLSAKSVAGEIVYENKRERFKEIDAKSDHRIPGSTTGVRKIMPWLGAAAAAIAVLIVGWIIWFKPVPSQELAKNYIEKNFETLPVTMGTREDSIQTGLNNFNEGQLPNALNQFESVLQSDPNSATAKKYAGIVSLRLGNYDKAIDYFKQLAADSALQVNQGNFLHALTLMKRNQQGDREAAKLLLKQVVANNQFGAGEAKRWLAKW